MPRKKRIRRTKAVEDLLVKNLENGILIERTCKLNPDIMPDPATVYRWAATDSEFNDRINQGYTCWLMKKMEELEEISTKPARELFPELDFKEAEATRKARMDALKFSLGKMAPVLSNRFSQKHIVEHQGKVDTTPQIVIANYATPEQIANYRVIDGDKNEDNN